MADCPKALACLKEQASFQVSDASVMYIPPVTSVWGDLSVYIERLCDFSMQTSLIE